MITRKEIKRYLRENSPDTLVKNKPLLFWCLESPKALKILLEHGADPNVDFEMTPGVSVTPLAVATCLKKRIATSVTTFRDFDFLSVCRAMNKTSARLQAGIDLIRRAGGKSVVYREYIRVDVRE